MKSVDFIRKFGWEKVRDGIRNIKPYEEYLIGIYNSDMKEIEGVVYIDRTQCKANVDDLKTYVDAWDLVEKRGGLSEAKAIEQQYWNSGVGAAMIVAMEIKQAIELVESVNENQD